MTARKYTAAESFPPAKVLRKLLQEQPTPFYLYDAAALGEACACLRETFSWQPGFEIYFPVRMNPNPAVLRVLADAGAGMLCASEAELRLARRAEIEGTRMIYAPFAMDDHAFAYSRRIGAACMIDAEHALAPQPPARVFLNVNPGGKLCFDARAVWNFEKSKLGMNTEALVSMCRRFLASGTQTISLAVFLRDQDAEIERLYAAIDSIFRLAARLKRELALPVDGILISGGFGICYRPTEQPADLQALSLYVRKKYDEILMPEELEPKLQLAPGRFLAARAGVLVTRVLAVKQQQLPLVVLDADCGQFLREIAFGANHRLTAPLVPDSRPKCMVRAAGALCDLRDHFPGTFVLPELKLGECVLVCDTGADGRSFASGYGGSLGCAEFLLERSGETRCIRSRQTMQQLLSAFDADESEIRAW